ncbi:MAG: type II CAAX endopeptidase family protein [Gammaproteobacteria bacterium]|jgi:membrane protease YdiL (CAAX protease family)
MRHERLIEVLVFLFLVVPSLVFSFFGTGEGRIGFDLMAWAVILRDLALVSLIFFFLWRNGEALRKIGVTFVRGWGEVILGIVLFLPFNFLAGQLKAWLQGVGFSAPATPLPDFLTAHGDLEVVLAIVLVTVIAFSEEIIFRGYLITRFQAITRNAGVALVLAAFIFSLGHGYEGSSGVITVGVMGLIFGLIYIWRGSLVAPMTMHFLQDFIGIVLGPIITSHMH